MFSNKFIIKLNIKNLVTMFYLFYFMSAHISFMNDVWEYTYIFLGCILLIVTLRKIDIGVKKIIILLTTFSLFGFMSSVIISNVGWWYIIFCLSNMGAALGTCYTLEKYASITFFEKILFIMCIAYLIYFMLNGTLDTMYQHSSENYVSIYLIAFFGLYTIESEINKRKVSVFLAGCCLLLTILSNSRTGIVCLLILLFGVVAIRILRLKGGKLVTGIGFFLCGVGALFCLIFYSGVIFEAVYDAPRVFIWQTYLSYLNDIKHVVLGVPFKLNYHFLTYYKNMHNVFFNIHARFGLIPLVIGIYIYMSVFYNAIKKKDMYNLLIIFVIFLRSLTDNAAFPETLDFILFTQYFYFGNIKFKNMVKISERHNE